MPFRLRYPGEHIIGQPNTISSGTVDGPWSSSPFYYWFPFSLVTESHCHLMAIPCVIGKFICFFSPQFTTGWSTSKESHHHMHWLWCRTAHRPHSQLPFWRNAMESSWGFRSADAVHLHHEETILGHHFLLFKAHSVTESWRKSKDTGYFVGLNYPETVGVFWKTHTHTYTHSFSFQDPFIGQLHWETQLILRTPTPPWEANTTNIRNSLQGARNPILYNDGTRLHLPNICVDTDSPITRSLNEENILILLSKGGKLINLPKWLFPNKAILYPTKLVQEWIPTVSQVTLTTDPFSPCYLLSIKKTTCIHIHSSNLLSYGGTQHKNALPKIFNCGHFCWNLQDDQPIAILLLHWQQLRIPLMPALKQNCMLWDTSWLTVGSREINASNIRSVNEDIQVLQWEAHWKCHRVGWLETEQTNTQGGRRMSEKRSPLQNKMVCWESNR